MGPVVTDQNGNGYVAWLHRSGAGDVDRFCKLSPGARICSHPITLPVTLVDSSASTDTPFPVLGPGFRCIRGRAQLRHLAGGDVGVDRRRRELRPGVRWADQPGPVKRADVYRHLRRRHNLDTSVPFNAYGGEYDRSQGTSTLSSNGIQYE